MSYPMALIDLRFNVRVQNIPRGEFLDEEGLCMRTQNSEFYLLYICTWNYTLVKILTEKAESAQIEGNKIRVILWYSETITRLRKWEATKELVRLILTFAWRKNDLSARVSTIKQKRLWNLCKHLSMFLFTKNEGPREIFKVGAAYAI